MVIYSYPQYKITNKKLKNKHTIWFFGFFYKFPPFLKRKIR